MIILAGDKEFEALLNGNNAAGYPAAEDGIETPEILAMLRELANQIRKSFNPAAWLIEDNSRIVGLCSLLSPPDCDGCVVIGYGIAGAYQGRGIGTGAIRDVADWARQHPGINAITAETAVSNYPSQKILTANGFVCSGERHDIDDGDLYCWKLSTL